MEGIESIFKVMPYYFARSWRKRNYPEFKTKVVETLYMKTLEEVDAYMIRHGSYYREFKEKYPELKSNLYAYVVLEIPLGVETHVDVLGENLSTRIYLPDGSLWGENTYADFIPMSSHGDEYNYWGRRNLFWGRKPEEIKFKPGDIVEVMGYPGNHYWGNNCVNLAIVVKTPPTVDEVAAMREHYLATHSGFDVCDHAMCYEFGHDLDTYEVLSFACNQIDHAPTISVFNTTKQVSSMRRTALQKMIDNYIIRKTMMKKVIYSEYEGKYDESIKEKLEKDPGSVDVEMMRANLYGYTYTKEYADGDIPDELSMDYWEERHEEMELDNLNFEDFEMPDNLDSLLEDMDDSPYFDVSPQEKLILETIDSTGDGKTPETALCVIDVHQEYEYIQRVVRLSVLQLVKQSVRNGIDCLELKNYDGRIEKVYFDISRRFEVG